MKKANAMLRGRGRPFAVPGVEPDMMVVATSGNKRCLAPIHHGHLKPQEVAVKAQRPVQVGHLQVYMPDARLWGYGIVVHVPFKYNIHWVGRGFQNVFN